MTMLAAAFGGWGWVTPFLNIILFLLGIFLILLILIQRGKGGGLAGAFGGAGGSSAFGSRAGDAFTRVTIFVAAFWLLLIMIMIKGTQDLPPQDTSVPVVTAPSTPGTETPPAEQPEEK
jgi:preprotein translocase subunit SecG